MWKADEMMALLCGLMTEHWRGKLKTTHICILQLLNGIHWNVNNEKIHIFHETLFAYFHFFLFLFIFIFPPFGWYILSPDLHTSILYSIWFQICAKFYLYRLNCFDSSQNSQRNKYVGKSVTKKRPTQRFSNVTHFTWNVQSENDKIVWISSFVQ